VEHITWNMNKIILVKLGEIWLKGKNRDDFVNRLVLNICTATGLNKKDVETGQGRLYLHNLQPTTHNLQHVFGIHSFVKADKMPLDYEKLKEVVVNLVKEKIKNDSFLFRVSANRAFKKFEKTSEDINKEIGAVLLDNFPKQLKVDLKKSNMELVVEVRESGIYIYFKDEEVPGPGGLPLGISGRALAMLSGGIDSPVAMWQIMRRGMRTDAIHFFSPPFTGEKAKQKVVDLCRKLAPHNGGEINLYLVNFSKLQVETKKAPEGLWTLLHRRLMVKIAQEIAQKNNYDTLVSGESLGQVASQTIQNIRAVSYNINFPILRPLVGFDKQDTINIAKQIGTYEISILPYQDCCTIFSARNPKTKTNPDEVAKMEEKLDLEELIAEAVEDTYKNRITN